MPNVVHYWYAHCCYMSQCGTTFWLSLSVNKLQILSFIPNHILSRKLTLLLFAYIYIAVACFVPDRSKFISIKHPKLYAAVHVSV